MAVCCHTANKYSKAKYFLEMCSEHNEFHSWLYGDDEDFSMAWYISVGIESDHLSQLSGVCVCASSGQCKICEEFCHQAQQLNQKIWKKRLVARSTVKIIQFYIIVCVSVFKIDQNVMYHRQETFPLSNWTGKRYISVVPWFPEEFSTLSSILIHLKPKKKLAKFCLVDNSFRSLCQTEFRTYYIW